MQVLLGVIFHFIGGFASGSFYIPFKKVKGWSWESFWIIGGLFSWLFVPALAAWLTVPGFITIIRSTDFSVLCWTYILGLLWGVGGMTYGLGVRYLGVSLGSTIILGLCAVFGALIPSVYYNIFPKAGRETFSELLHTTWGQMVLLGILLCVLGIVICGKAGVMKEKDMKMKDDVAANNHEYNLRIGLVVAIISGILSACFNFGLEAGRSMSEAANALWKQANPGEGEFLFRNNVTYIIVLWGGLSSNFVGCMILNARNKSFGNYTDPKTPLLKNYLFSALAGTTWFLQFFFYGMGESKLGNGASSWILHMAFIILIANVWGLVLKEWKGVNKKAFSTVIIGILVIILSVIVVGYGNKIK